MSPHTCQNGQPQKNKNKKKPQMKNVGKDMKKSELLYTVGGNVNWYSPCGKQSGGFSKNYDPAILLLGIQPKKPSH